MRKWLEAVEDQWVPVFASLFSWAIVVWLLCGLVLLAMTAARSLE